MTSSAKQSSRNRVKVNYTAAEIEEIITDLGGPAIFFHPDGTPRRAFFELSRPLSLVEIAGYLYGDEPTCPKSPSFIIMVDRLIVCQKDYWCLTWQGQLIGDPIPSKVT